MELLQLCIAQSPDNVLQAYTGVDGDVDAVGDAVPEGAPALINPETGQIYCLNKSALEIATEAGSFEAADGSTVDYVAGSSLITLDNGETFCVPPKAEVIVSSSADEVLGSIAVDGVTIPVVTQLPTKSGNDVSLTNKLITEALNPPVGWGCVDGAVQVELCDGSFFCFRNESAGDFVAYSATTVDDVTSDSLAGDIISPETGCITIPPQKLGTKVKITIEHSYIVQPHDGQWGGSFAFRPAIAITPTGGAQGAWTNVTTGGVDQIVVGVTPPDTSNPQPHPVGEFTFTDHRLTVDVPPEGAEICFRIAIFNKTLVGPAGSPPLIETTAINMYGEWDEMICATVAATPLQAEGSGPE